jgi:hypothetical protein
MKKTIHDIYQCRYAAIVLLGWCCLAVWACSPSNTPGTTVDCSSLVFQLHRNNIDALGRGSATITLRPDEVSLQNLLCVAARLKEEHRAWNDVRVAMFDSVDVAQAYRFEWRDVGALLPQQRELSYERQKIATYVLRRAAGEEWLLLRLFALKEEEYETRLRLPLSGRPHCRFEFSDRCLLSAQEPRFPRAESGELQSSVTIAGDVNPRGQFTNLRVVETRGVPAPAVEAFSSSALDNARTWRFDPASGHDSVQIRFEYIGERASPTSTLGATEATEVGVTVEMVEPATVRLRRFVFP